MSLLSFTERLQIPDWDNPEECRYQRVTVDLAKCDGCKLCTMVCPANVLEMFGEKGKQKSRVKEDHRGCISCNNCHAICCAGAITATDYYDFTGYFRQFGRGDFQEPRKF